MESSVFRRVFNAKNITLLILLAAIIAFFSIAAKATGLGTFFSISNMRTILNSMVIVALLTIGAGCLLISGDLDLSAGYVGTLCGVMVAYFSTNAGMPWPLALIAAVIVGMIFGLFNAFLVNELNLQAFIATLATGYIAEGVSYTIGEGRAISLSDKPLVWLGSGMIGKVVPVAIIIAVALFIVYGIILSKTKFGRSVYYIGSNKAAAPAAWAARLWDCLLLTALITACRLCRFSHIIKISRQAFSCCWRSP